MNTTQAVVKTRSEKNSGLCAITACLCINQKMWIKCTKNCMQLQILKIVCIKKLHLHVYAWNICLSSMYEIVLLFSIFGRLSF